MCIHNFLSYATANSPKVKCLDEKYRFHSFRRCIGRFLFRILNLNNEATEPMTDFTLCFFTQCVLCLTKRTTVGAPNITSTVIVYVGKSSKIEALWRHRTIRRISSSYHWEIFFQTATNLQCVYLYAITSQDFVQLAHYRTIWGVVITRLISIDKIIKNERV